MSAHADEPDPARFAVLQGQWQIDEALSDLRHRGDWPDPGPGRGPRRLLNRRRARLRPDSLKAWDIRRALQLIEERVPRDAAILDMGSVGCPVLPVLRDLGYQRLVGIDLDPMVRRMPAADAIDYVRGDLTASGLPEHGFAAITSISVIEHGVADEALLAEVARLLAPGGFFAFSTDYWPEKIDTSEIALFGQPWRIFSAAEIEKFLATAERHGLRPSQPLDDRSLAASETPIHFADRSYTFLYGVLERAAPRAA